ncbi:putative transcription factor GRAS family [Rosa chinensis]|uniref:Putative transcription factor GRAS family n=1 Tax=Rosa chinensis TaxID=74649 RepID=A0A2P6RRU9_ROSCH|nr:putative transcription factor GRAS family [Rosa chinensis]
MEVELIDHPFNPSFDLYDCSFESDSSFQTSDLFTRTTNVDQNSDHECLNRMLQIESQLMDIDSSISSGSDVIGLDGVVDSEFASYISEEAPENVRVSTEGNSLLKEIQIDLLEESSLTELLFAGAEAVESQNWVFASNIIAKLNTLLSGSENGDNSFNKLATFFTKGLHYKTINSIEVPHEPAVSRNTETMSSFQMLLELSPFVKFAHFTANQAILEATQEDEDIHVIDFDIMEGSQWPSLMVDLARRKGRRCASLKVTAITVDQQSTALAQQTGRSRAAHELDWIGFDPKPSLCQSERFMHFEQPTIRKNKHSPIRSNSIKDGLVRSVRRFNPNNIIYKKKIIVKFNLNNKNYVK